MSDNSQIQLAKQEVSNILSEIVSNPSLFRQLNDNIIFLSRNYLKNFDKIGEEIVSKFFNVF